MKSVLPEGVILHRRYCIGRVLGIGGFGITYVVWDQLHRERLALKEYFPDEWAVRTPSGYRIVPDSQIKDAYYRHGREVFVEEARILSRLKNVPNVVNVKDFFLENGTAYMVMELLDGYTLSGYMRHRGMKSMPLEMAGYIIRETGIALQRVHEHMLLHRDVGPDNIMITRNGGIRLIDFGATRIYALNSSKSMSVLVKPGFAPIEQYSRVGKQGPWTDVYALAATYYFLVTGQKPPEAPERVAGAPVMPLGKLVPGIPGHISMAVEHALAEDWKERTHDISAFLQEIGLLKRPYVLLQEGSKGSRYYFRPEGTLKIGRTAEKNNIVLADSQVSGKHCKLWYEAKDDRFVIENYSSNLTYTSRGVLGKAQRTSLTAGEWFYIQTAHMRYIFYPEVE